MKTAFCFDLDGTLTKEEILPVIAELGGIEEEIKTLTFATINGLIPFESSFRLRCKLLEGLEIYEVKEKIRNIALYDNVRDFILENNADCFIITGNLNIWVDGFIKDNFKCSFYSSQGDFKSDVKNSILNEVLKKEDAISKIREKGYERIIAVGDGMGDVSMFQAADIGIAFGATHKPVKSLIEVSNFVTYSEESLCQLLKQL